MNPFQLIGDLILQGELKKEQLETPGPSSLRDMNAIHRDGESAYSCLEQGLELGQEAGDVFHKLVLLNGTRATAGQTGFSSDPTAPVTTPWLGTAAWLSPCRQGGP